MRRLLQIGQDFARRSWWVAVSRMIALVVIVAITAPAATDVLDQTRVAAPGGVAAGHATPAGMSAERQFGWQDLLLHIQVEAEHQAIDAFLPPDTTCRGPIRTSFKLGSEVFASAEVPGFRRPPRG